MIVWDYNFIRHSFNWDRTKTYHITNSLTLQFLDQLLDEEPLHSDDLVLTHFLELPLSVDLPSGLSLPLPLPLFPLGKNIGRVYVHLFQDGHELAVELLPLH